MATAFELNERIVLVTGGATGLGLAISQAFGDAGARIALSDLREGSAASAAESLRRDGIDCRAYAADVRDRAAIRHVVAAVERDFGRLDIVVANAGVYPNTPFLEMTEDQWDSVLDTNLKGVFLTCQAGAEAIIRGDRGGQIIALSSGAANHAIWGWSHYCASKAGVVALVRSMALELAPHDIRVNAILPGYIDVPEGGARLAESYKQAARSSIPIGRPGTPADIANAVLLLASPLAGFVTGASLVVDGGSSAGRAQLRPVDS
ncbi:MAG TPA: SDR family NAD(P)-dependent oxidoreductase [Thermomicrobiales bacterium]|nr:SDR family NAD(P)-dependent oxidoreductase [Thermomicrobiales bacterium]